MDKLTDRLQLMADQIEKGETMADIGTDHGFLPLYLRDNGISPKVIMCDISEPSLAKAKAAAGEYQFGNELDFRVGDGLDTVDCGEVNVIVIAGMGGLLIRDILSRNMKKTCSFDKFILQPRNNSGLLRYWLANNCFDITSNLLVREGKFICEIIVAIPTKSSEKANNPPVEDLRDPGSARWDFPMDMYETNPVLAREYAISKLETEKKIRNGILKSCNINDLDIITVEKRIAYFEKIVF
ncbi:MAG: class I SAM-dependent methyltransferase [Eubacteriales bacterium]|nr:class I SAM-dependent methyltransferase [Eubacteriales bacterium]